MIHAPPALAALACVLAAFPAVAADDLGRWHAGAYSYSDELGGFSILGISGTGRPDDPVVITQEFHSASPAVLMIRAEKPIRPHTFEGDYANGFIYMRVVAINNSGLPWVEFEFELQEVLGRPSTFGDGLSFDQRRTDSDMTSSDSYARYSRSYEPYDRLLFTEGHTDHLKAATFEFLITDFTPRWEFFLVQDPAIPAS